MKVSEETLDSQLLITDSGCAVCTSEHRNYIEMQLGLGMATKTLARFMSDLGGAVSAGCLTAHWQKHVSCTDAAIRRTWETRAREAFGDVDQVEGFLTTREGVMEVLREKFKAALLSGKVGWATGDAIAIIDALERHHNTTRGPDVETVMLQARTFVEAVRNVLPDEMYTRVLADYERRLAVRDETIPPDDLVIAHVATPPPGSADQTEDLDPTTSTQ